jgi:hypothetical protein
MAGPTFKPVDFDPFAAPGPSPAAKQPTLVPVDHDPFAEAKPSVVEDVAKSAGAGLLEGGMRMAAMPLEFLQGAVRLGANIGNKAREAVGLEPYTPEQMAELDRPMPGTFEFNKQAVQKVADPFYEPKTTPGEYAKTGGEFAASAPLIPGGVVAKTLQTVGPALVTEFAGQKAREVAPELEPYVRTGAAVISGGVAALAPRSAPKAVAASHLSNVTDDAVLAAGRLMEEAQSRGIGLTWPEAIAQVSDNATSLTTLQRFVEGSEAGGEVMRGFMSRRPSQIEQAGRSAFDELSPPIANPSAIGPEVGRAAQGTVDEVQGAINAATRPAYQAAESAVIEPQAFSRLLQDPLFAQTLREVRSDPSLSRTIANLPDEAVGTVDLVQRRMREAADNASLPGQASTSNLRASNFESARNPAIEAAEAATGGPTGSYATARAAQQELRSKYLQPILDGPLGRLAQKDLTTRNAIDALFPSNPLPGGAQETGSAVAALAKKNRPAAERLVRAHAESVFNEATQRLQSGANEFGGAKFAAQLVGNPEQAAALEAAVRALPDGGARWDGFNKFLNVLEATGKRQRQGSPTASNLQIEESLRSGGKVGEISSLASGGFLKLPERLKQAYERYRLGQGTAELAKLFTDPAALPVFRQLAREGAGSSKAQALSARLIAIGGAEAGRGTSAQSQ